MEQAVHRCGLRGRAAWLRGALAGDAADPVYGRPRADPLYRPVQRRKPERVPRPGGRVDACLLSQGHVPKGTSISDLGSRLLICLLTVKVLGSARHTSNAAPPQYPFYSAWFKP